MWLPYNDFRKVFFAFFLTRPEKDTVLLLLPFLEEYETHFFVNIRQSDHDITNEVEIALWQLHYSNNLSKKKKNEENGIPLERVIPLQRVAFM